MINELINNFFNIQIVSWVEHHTCSIIELNDFAINQYLEKSVDNLSFFFFSFTISVLNLVIVLFVKYIIYIYIYTYAY